MRDMEPAKQQAWVGFDYLPASSNDPQNLRATGKLLK